MNNVRVHVAHGPLPQHNNYFVVDTHSQHLAVLAANMTSLMHTLYTGFSLKHGSMVLHHFDIPHFNVVILIREKPQIYFDLFNNTTLVSQMSACLYIHVVITRVCGQSAACGNVSLYLCPVGGTGPGLPAS